MNTKYTVVTFEHRLVGPIEASEMLGRTHPRNRVIRQSIVKSYAADIAAGVWDSEACVPIIVHEDGTVLDGQHRLAAIVRSGIALWCVIKIVSGDKDAILQNIDQGEPRKGKDAFQIAGYGSRDASVIVAATRLLLLLRDGNLSSTGGKFSNRQTLDMFADNRGIAEVVFSINKTNGNSSAIPISILAFIAYITDRIDPVASRVHMYGLIYGVGLQVDDPELLLRAAMERNRMSRIGKRSRAWKLAMAFKAWNLRVTGRRTKILKWMRPTAARKGEAFPRLVDSGGSAVAVESLTASTGKSIPMATRAGKDQG